MYKILEVSTEYKELIDIVTLLTSAEKLIHDLNVIFPSKTYIIQGGIK